MTIAPVHHCSVAPPKRDNRPNAVLPGQYVEINESARHIGKLLKQSGDYYSRFGLFSRISEHHEIEHIEPHKAASVFEKYARMHARHVRTVPNPETGKDEQEWYLTPTVCSRENALRLTAADAFIDELPPIRVVSLCPVLTEHDGKLRTISGYDRETGIYAFGEPTIGVSFTEASLILQTLIEDWNFPTEHDRARAMAILLSPAVVLGGLLGPEHRTPQGVLEADQSQAGKGYFAKLAATIYGARLETVNQKRGGVGSMEESISKHMLAGRPIVCLDNLRDKIDCPFYESVLTEHAVECRVPYAQGKRVDPSRTMFLATSNKSEFSLDLANRSIIVRISKQGEGYQFTEYAEGGLLEHVTANRPQYLGAVFAILREWHARGKPGGFDGRHDFRRWAGAMNHIVRDMLDMGDMLEGHRAVQRRTSNPSENWLRELCIAVDQAGMLGQTLATSELLDVLENADVPAPGFRPHDDLEDDATRMRIMRAIGRKLRTQFKASERAIIDRHTITRTEQYSDAANKFVKKYTFTRQEVPF